MNKLLLSTAIAAAIGLPAIALAQGTSATPAAPWVCHAPHGSETANGAIGSTKVYCRAVNVARVRAAQRTVIGMMHQHELNAADTKAMDAAMKSVTNELDLPVLGTNDNPNY